ncbi:MAG: beta-ketoacyl synthase [Gammaproteobacteria bacterium]|nr:beta-ketoacyl synthase [Gammaproteobacteria bacterium]
MSRLPVIVGFGGINAAGRISSHHAYRRMVIDGLPTAAANETYASLRALMNLEGDANDPKVRQYILDHTLIRRIEPNLMDCDAIPWQRTLHMEPNNQSFSFVTKRRQLPDVIPKGWEVSDVGDDDARVDVDGAMDVLVRDFRISRVQSGGQLPTGFEPDKLYQSRNHPRGLQLTIYGASDAIGSLGIDWEVLRQKVKPDQIAVYAGSGMSQLDTNGNGGMLQARLLGKRATSKQVALGLPEMPADFVNAYVLGSVGATGCNIGACATFLYNLRAGMDDIRSGQRRVVFVGNSEAPITPEIIEGYRTLGALAEDEALMALDGTEEANHRRACRPFSDNAGFTLAEASVFVVLFDDALALELGANIHGAVGDVFINADGYKKSIPSPGIGNYITVAKALASARAMLGSDALRRSFIQAHGTGTPQNRITESHIMNEMSKVFGLQPWTVSAIKAYVGHSLAPASGDQIIASLGVWKYGIIPGIATIDHIADDVHASHLRLQREHIEVDPTEMDAAFINSKGFGGNNATSVLLAPHIAKRMLEHKYGPERMREHAAANEVVAANAEEYDRQMTNGSVSPIYRFGEGVLEGKDLTYDTHAINVPGFDQAIDLDLDNPYPDMSPDRD